MGLLKILLPSTIELKSSYLTDGEKITYNTTAHGDWLPVSQTQDANETVKVICELNPDWIIVDHYALDAIWFSIVEKTSAKTFVIDDLGDRELICDVLLDQNLGASAEKYHRKLPINCQLLLGLLLLYFEVSLKLGVNVVWKAV